MFFDFLFFFFFFQAEDGIRDADVTGVQTRALPILRSILKKQLRDVHTVEQFQLWLTGMLELLLKRTCKKIEVRGLDRIPLGQTHLWLSNHRDIAMDPLLINYSLHKAGWPTSRKIGRAHV